MESLWHNMVVQLLKILRWWPGKCHGGGERCDRYDDADILKVQRNNANEDNGADWLLH